MHDFRVSKSLGTIGVVVGVVGVAWVISVVSVVGRTVVRVFALCMTFTFVWGRFVRSGTVWRIKVLVNDFSDVSFLRGPLVGSSPVSEACWRYCSCCSTEANRSVGPGIVESHGLEPDGVRWSVAWQIGGFLVIVLVVVLVGIIVE